MTGPRPTDRSRRDFLRALGLAGGAALGAPLLSACGTKGAAVSSDDQKASTDLSDTEKTLAFSNWPLYIDIDEETSARPTLEAFERQTGVKVVYTEDVNDNDQFFAKVRPQLSAQHDSGRDIFVLTDWMAGRVIRLGWTQEIDRANVPNAKNVRAALAEPGFDPGRKFSLPWATGLTGVAANLKATGGREVRTMTELLTAPWLKGKVTCLTEMRDTVGLILLEQGKDPANCTDDDFGAALEMLQKAVDTGQIRQFTGNEYAEQLGKGSIAAAVAWSGDVIQLQAENDLIRFTTPESGSMIWSDNMLIPIQAKHKKNAELLIDHYYDPQVAAQLAAYVNYICPVEGAKQEMEAIDPELAKSPLIFPDDATLAQTHFFMDLDQAVEQDWAQRFQKVTGA